MHLLPHQPPMASRRARRLRREPRRLQPGWNDPRHRPRLPALQRPSYGAPPRVAAQPRPARHGHLRRPLTPTPAPIPSPPATQPAGSRASWPLAASLTRLPRPCALDSGGAGERATGAGTGQQATLSHPCSLSPPDAASSPRCHPGTPSRAGAAGRDGEGTRGTPLSRPWQLSSQGAGLDVSDRDDGGGIESGTGGGRGGADTLPSPTNADPVSATSRHPCGSGNAGVCRE